MTTRREFLAMPAFLAAHRDRRPHRRTPDRFRGLPYRAPYKFGGKEVDRVTMLNVHCRVSNRTGKSATDIAAMSMGNVWSLPCPGHTVRHDARRHEIAGRRRSRRSRRYTEYAHPLDINHALEPEYLKAAVETTREMKLARPVPKLCTLVTASPVDAAIHDAFGRLHGRNAFHTSGKDFVHYDLEHYLGRANFAASTWMLRAAEGRAAHPHVSTRWVRRDALTAAEVKKPDRRRACRKRSKSGSRTAAITAIKIKLNGSDLAWDVDRVVGNRPCRDRGAGEARRPRVDLLASTSTSAVPTSQYLLDFERQVKAKAPAAFEQVQYIEQPTARDLAADREEHDVRGGQTAAGSDRRIADGPGYAAARA